MSGAIIDRCLCEGARNSVHTVNMCSKISQSTGIFEETSDHVFQSGEHSDAVEGEWRGDEKQEAVDERAAVEQVVEVRKWVAWLFEHLELHLVGKSALRLTLQYNERQKYNILIFRFRL